MGELDDLEEIDLTAHHDNDERVSARRIRAGKRRVLRALKHRHEQPLWRKQLTNKHYHGKSDTDPPEQT